jgi:hypothetical protein
MNAKRSEKRLERKNDELMERSGNFENPLKPKAGSQSTLEFQSIS